MYKTTLRKTDGTEYTVDTYNGLTEQTTTTQSTHAPKEIFYGGVPKTGSMKIDDPQREIVDKVLDGTFDLSDTTVKTYYNDKLQGVFKTSDSDYEENSGELSVSLVDNISNWDKIQFAGRDYSLRADDALKPNLYEILSYVLMTTLKWDTSYDMMEYDVENMCSYTISVNTGTVVKDMTIREYLMRIIIPYDYVEAADLRSTMDKICTVAQLNYAETNENGGIYPRNIRFFNARPAKAKSEGVITLPPFVQNTFPVRDILLKNIYTDTYIVSYNVIKKTEIGANVYRFFEQINDLENIEWEFDTAKNWSNINKSAYAYAYVKNGYININVRFPQRYNHNLFTIEQLYLGKSENNANNIKVVIDGEQQKGYSTAPLEYGSGSSVGLPTEPDIDDFTNIIISKINSETEMKDVSYTYSFKYGLDTETVTASTTANTNIADPNIMTFRNGYYETTMRLCVWQETIGVKSTQSYGGGLKNWSGDYSLFVPKQITISFYGITHQINFEEVTKNSSVTARNIATLTGNSLLQDKAFFASTYIDNQTESKNNVSLSTSQLNALYGDDGESLWSLYSFDPETGAYKTLGKGTKFNNLTVGTKYYGKRNYDSGIDEVTITSGNATDGYELSITSHYVSYDEIGSVIDRLSNSILSDYANGVSTCTTEITLDQLKYTDGTIAKQASDGEIIHIGDVVRLDRNSLGDSMYNYADGNPYLWRVTGTTLIYDGYPHQKLELQEITSGNRGLKYMSWETIESIANSGQAQNVFSIGDEKEIELSTGEKLTAVIIGFNHDKISDTKKAGITFFIKTPLATNYKMNSNQGVSTYWGSCSLRTTLLNDIKNTLPGWDDEEGVISANNLIKRLKPVQKNIFDYNDSVQTLTDDLFLLSAYEIGKLVGNVVWAQEGTQYAYFADNDNSVRALKNTDGVSVEWWTCSLGKKSTTTYREQYIYRNKTGALFSTSNQTYSKAVAFAFCIGEVDA